MAQHPFVSPARTFSPLRRALGGQGSKGVPPNLEKIAWSYDAALIVPRMHAAQFLNSPFARAGATSAP